ncbi:MAG: histidine kinase [Gammaproteobacteria bacterium]|jgi:sensor histidine kinase YesM|nr:histidine kinase [Gammaproteobacteria bacterium]MBT3859056.1 histidine kinase [Gammaproteobacteria bacterium]MBT4254602.1 histidine kinase [Gammaproteobacteria bacterium]MBT4580679.1 histidine kinase [Gammaproteobacteria bacterium]MBT4658614.1 histidine kinase [Gammaproteobacteria bacterium]
MSISTLALIRSKQFWIFQLVGWSIWVSLRVFGDLFFVPPEYLFPRALVYALSALAAVVLTTLLRKLYKMVWERGFVVRFLVTWFASLVVALVWQPFQNYIALIPYGEVISLADASTEDLFDGWGRISFPLILLWSGLYYIIKYYQLFQAEKEKSLRSEALAHEAQLLMLRYQLNPHFLFNTLNAISTLVLSESTEQANGMLTKLSKFLRYSLDHSPLDKVSLAHELETSRLYLDIEEVRFGERLRLEMNIEREAENAMVPTMILQPLIENSIKYAISKSESGGTISITARTGKDEGVKYLLLKVSDDGPGLPDNDGESDILAFSQGVGISNIRNRLQQIYGERHDLEFFNAKTGGLTVMVKIPYDRT